MTAYRFFPTVGPFSFAIATDDPAVREDIARTYSHFPLQRAPDFVDFRVTVRSPTLWRRYLRPQVTFELDAHRPFKPLPRQQGYAMLEWGMNWCIANHAHQYLIVHAAVLERDGQALLMPAEQGAGKSTLTAALAYAGWRLFSDELALIDPATGWVWPVPRPINLKNASIDVMAAHLPQAVFSRRAYDTVKGTVALLRPPAEAVQAMHQPAPIAAVVFPRYCAGERATLNAVEPAEAFEETLRQAFNYHILGREAFEVLADVFSERRAWRLHYSAFEQAQALLAPLTASV